MAQRHAVAEARLLKKWICMKCSATHRGTKAPRACRKCGYKNFRQKAAGEKEDLSSLFLLCSAIKVSEPSLNLKTKRTVVYR